MEILIGLGWLVGGVLALGWALRTGRALMETNAEPNTLAEGTAGQVVEMAAEVVDGARLTSPLQGSHAVFWHVRAIRISSLRRTVGPIVDVERTSAPSFVVQVEGQRLQVDGTTCRMGTGFVKVHADQGSFSRPLVIDGERFELPPIAHGVRHVQEGTLRPGQQIWVRGRLETGVAGHSLGPLDHQRGVVVHTISLSARRRRLGVITVVVGGFGTLLLMGAFLWLT